MDPVAAWHAALDPARELTPAFCRAFADRMRAAKLTFGERVHCRVLRPFFLTPGDEARIRRAAEAIAAIGERVAAAVDDAALRQALGVTGDEERLVRLEPGYTRASTASRLDAFVLPGSLHFAEYNAESPAGPGYTQRLCELFDALDVTRRFREGGHRMDFRRTIAPLLEALLESYREWGGRAAPPLVAIVDWLDVPTWSEFELLAEAFIDRGVPTVVCDPRNLTFEGGRLRADGHAVDLVYRRVLTSDVLARPDDCWPLVRACEQRAVCMASTFRCKMPHKKAFFAILTDPAHAHRLSPAEQEIVRAHVPWTRLVADTAVERHGRRASLLEVARAEREQLVLKPNDEYGGTGVRLGWESTEGAWDTALNAALADPPGTWVLQERIPVRREVFPLFDDEGRVTMTDMLVDLAPYLFRGRMHGFLTRLSVTGLANVTSGGGQVPTFVIDG
jgi:hypothetical protein